MKGEKSNLGNVRHIEPVSAGDSSLRYIMMDANADDEISLIDLWLVITKRRSLFLAVVLLVLLAGVFAALSLPAKYNFSTALEVGGVSYDGSGRLVYIEDPASVLAKINQSYIPFTIKMYLQQKPEFDGVPEVKASLVKNSNIIFIDIKGVEKFKNTYIELLNSIVDKVKRDHKRISSLKIKDLELSKNRIKNKIVGLQGEERLILSQRKRLDKKEILLEARIKETRKQLNASMSIKNAAASESRTEGKVLALLMMDNELRESRGVLAKLEESLQITLENDRETMLNRLTKNRQLQSEAAMMLENVEAKSNNLLETRAITAPMQSIKPVGVGSKLIVVISLLVGVFLALFMVFFAEFISKVKKHKASM